jgi:hypothetical protein
MRFAAGNGQVTVKSTAMNMSIVLKMYLQNAENSRIVSNFSSFLFALFIGCNLARTDYRV